MHFARRGIGWGAALIVGAATPLVAQVAKVTSCAAADSLWGPLTPRQAKQSINMFYIAELDSSRIFSGRNGDTPVSILVRLPGRAPFTALPAFQLRVMVPAYLMERDEAGQVSVYAIVDDSIRSALTPPAELLRFQGPMRPQFAPAYLRLTVEQVRLLAGAHTVAASWFGKRVGGSPDDLAALQGVLRAVVCQTPFR